MKTVMVKKIVIQTLLLILISSTFLANNFNYLDCHKVSSLIKALSTESMVIEPNYVWWYQLTNASVNTNNCLTKTLNTTSWGESGAFSKNVLYPNTTGWVNYTVPQGKINMAFGLSQTNLNNHYTSILYTFLINSNKLYILNEGVLIGSFGSVITNDVLKIEKSGTLVYFYKNTQLLYTLAIAQTNLDKKVYVDVAISTPLAACGKIKTSFNPEPLNFNILKEHADYDNPYSGVITLNPSGGIGPLALLNTELQTNDTVFSNLSPQKLNFTLTDSIQDTLKSIVNIGLKNVWRIQKDASITNDYYTNTRANTDSLGVLVSYNTIPPQINGYTEFVVGTKNQNASFGFLGFSVNDVDLNYSSAFVNESSITNSLRYSDSLAYPRLINNQILTHQVNEVYNRLHLVTLTNGIVKIGFKNYNSSQVITYNEGDLFRLERNANIISLYKNEQLLASETLASGDQYLLSTLLLRTASNRFKSIGSYASIPGFGLVGIPMYHCPDEPNLNWVQSRTFNETGSIITESKEFMDALGRTMQTQSKLFSKNNVLVVEPLYDAFGRAIGQTLPAPSYNSNICYVSNFVEQSTGVKYNYTHYDNPAGVAAPGLFPTSPNSAPGDVNHPLPVDNNQQGKLGWYYSDNNTTENLVASDDYPYSRVEYYDDMLGRPKRVSGVGSNHYMGSNHETKYFYTSTPVVSADLNTNELNAVFPFRTYELERDFTYLTAPPSGINLNLQLFKTIAINPDGKDQITYSTSSGQTIATCISGDGDACVTNIHEVVLSDGIYNQTPKTIYIPKLKANTFYFFEKNTYTNIKTFANIFPVIKDAQTGYLLQLGLDYTYNTTNGTVQFISSNYINQSLYLLVDYTYVGSYVPLNTYVYASVEASYTQWTLYFYDRKDRLLGNVSPNDIICQSLATISQKTSQSGSSPITCSGSSSEMVIYFNEATLGSANKKIHLQFKPEFRKMSSNTFGQQISNFTFLSDSIKQLQDSSFFANTNFNIDGDSSFIHPLDTSVIANQLYDSVTANYYRAFDSTISVTPKYALLGKQIRYVGSYQLFAVLANGSHQALNVPNIPFDYTIEMDPENSTNDSIKMRIPYVPKVIKVKKLPFINSDLVQEDGDYEMGPSTNPTLLPGDLPQGTIGIGMSPIGVNMYPIGFGDGTDTGFSPCGGNSYLPESGIPTLLAMNNTLKPNLVFIAMPENEPIPLHLANKYMYDEYDRLVGSDNEDEGHVDYLYDQKEDKLMFTQNDKQRATGGKFNSIVYDKLARTSVVGEYDPQAYSPFTPYVFVPYYDIKNLVTIPAGFISVATDLQNNINNTYLNGRLFDRTHIEYDAADDYLPINIANTAYTQKHTAGKVTKTYNDKTTTWLSYDELGRQTFGVENSAEMGFKTIDYSYDLRGKLLQTVYQKNQSDHIYHQYSYDADERLTMAKYGRVIVGDGLNYSTLANYSYYLHGALKRQVLGGGMQGLDYVYTIGGLLKSVNNPLGTDPGNDGLVGGVNASVGVDIFSFALNYYDFDYVRNGSPIKAIPYNSSFTGQNQSYTGVIKTATWKTTLPTGAPASYGSQALMFEYKYNELYQLTDAQFGTTSIVPGSPSHPLDEQHFTTLPEYKLQNISYDKNGNLQTLKRYAATSGVGSAHLLDDITYNYSATKKNRLLQVGDVSTNPGGYASTIDLPNQTNAANYTYNQIGELIENKQEDQGFEYNASGLTTRVFKLSTGNTIASFNYNNKGLRHTKTSYNALGAPTKATYYSYDAGGTQLASYTKDLITTGATVLIQDFTLYGAGRVAVLDMTTGKAFYELSDHLGNVRAVIEKIASGGAQAVSYTDYYPHGGTLPERNFTSSTGYRFGFQGQEKDAETNLANFELRQYDARLGRWYNPDPMGQHHSPYLAMGNNPVSVTDPNGGWDNSGGMPGGGGASGGSNGGGYGNSNNVDYSNNNNNQVEERMIQGQEAGPNYDKFMEAYALSAPNQGMRMKQIENYLNKLKEKGINLEQTEAHPGEFGKWLLGTNVNYGDDQDGKTVLRLDGIGASVVWVGLINKEDVYRYRKYESGPITYYLHGVFDGVGKAAGGTIMFFLSDAWKSETWKNLASTAYAVQNPLSFEGRMLQLSIANKAISADIYDWGDFSGQVLFAAAGTKGLGVAKGAGAAAELSSVAKTGVQYTKSSLKLGQQMHKAYKVGANGVKEFRGIKGIRPDFVDFSTKTIYELKPFNPRAMQQGMKQLDKYKSLFEQNYGGTWKTILDTY